MSSERFRTGFPFAGDELYELRREQRAALRGLPTWMIHRVALERWKHLPPPPGDERFAELALRRSLRTLCEDEALSSWLENSARFEEQAILEATLRGVDEANDGDAPRLRSMISEAHRAANRVDLEGELDDPKLRGLLLTVIPLLAIADQLADDGYVDSRVRERSEAHERL